MAPSTTRPATTMRWRDSRTSSTSGFVTCRHLHVSGLRRVDAVHRVRPWPSPLFVAAGDTELQDAGALAEGDAARITSAGSRTLTAGPAGGRGVGLGDVVDAWENRRRDRTSRARRRGRGRRRFRRALRPPPVAPARPDASRATRRAADVGGTWYWNRYPGARCDIESMDYSYSFSAELEQEWTWTERYADPAGDPALHQPRRRPLRPAPRHPVRDAGDRGALSTRRAKRWDVETDRGDRVSAQFCIMATGCLSAAQAARVQGHRLLRRRDGTTPATGRTRTSISRGKRVGVDRHGLVGDPVDPASSPQQADARDGVPADAELQRCRRKNAPLDPERRAAEQGASYASSRQADARVARRLRRCPSTDVGAVGAARSTPRSGDARATSAAGRRGGLRARRRVHRPADRPGGQRHRRRVRPQPRSATSSRDPAVAERLSPARPPVRHQAPVRRHRLLRDVQPRQRHAGRRARRPRSRRSRRRGLRTSAASTQLDSHRVRHRLRRHDRRARSTSTSAGRAA